MSDDVAPLTDLLLRLEADAHRGGLDGPPVLYVLYDSRDLATDQAYRQAMSRLGGLPVRRGPYAALPMASAEMLGFHPQHGLFRMALNLTFPDHPITSRLLEILRQPGFLGVAFLCETWLRSTADKRERDSWQGKRLADMPGSQEARLVSAADITGQDYVVCRVRGRKPECWHARDAEMADVGGSVAGSLRTIVAAVAGLPIPGLPPEPSMWSWDEQVTTS